MSQPETQQVLDTGLRLGVQRVKSECGLCVLQVRTAVPRAHLRAAMGQPSSREEGKGRPCRGWSQPGWRPMLLREGPSFFVLSHFQLLNKQRGFG